MASAAWNHPGRNPPTNTDPFAHVRYLPMFGLLADEDFAIVAKTHEHAAKMAGYVQPVPELNIAEKVVLHASGIDIINPRKIDNALIKTNVAAITLTATAVHVAILTRWSAISDDGRTVVVDVYETRAIMGTQLGNPWMLKSNVDARLLVAGKRKVKTKAQKTATKTWTRTPVEGLVIVGASGGRDIDMVLVVRQQREISPAEGPLVRKRFKAWVVPGNG